MGFSPLILHCYWFVSCSGSMPWISDPCRLPWFFLGLVGGENDSCVRNFIPLVVVSLLICVLEFVWASVYHDETFRCFVSGGSSACRNLDNN
ncbi:hypothetical protein RchiOBHm_Chr1g0348871 [Rosa chinensis]|uniref:Transmembrane protein n=1 Tax=Rosa chinensis TaxID=74649 RepID=A0A2P6SFQ2_ROSCH|nr:hypothetical protein RchiOBHm_Chr1g0348871 [Rosa chinensis]